MTLKQKKLLSGNLDLVNKPDHYQGTVECIDAIEASLSPEAFKGMLKGNCMKYLWRYEKKIKPLEDLEKCQWYLQRLINTLKGDKQ